MKVHEPLPHQEQSAKRSGAILCLAGVNRCSFVNKLLCTALPGNLQLSTCVIIALHSKPCSTVILRHWHQFYHCFLVGGAVWVLGGEHICTALQKLQAEYLQGGNVLPEWLSHVQCDMIKGDTKLSISSTSQGTTMQLNIAVLRRDSQNLETAYGISLLCLAMWRRNKPLF